MIAAPAQTSDRSRQRILVVDDDPAVLDLVITRLEIAGYETRRARDGAAAVDRLAEVRPAAMILDLNMPKLDGFGVLDLMSQRTDLAGIPVLILSARSAPNDVKLAIAMGASDYLSKPFETSRLLSRVARLVQFRKPSAPPAPSTPPDDDTFLI
ncbi:MAG: response regulator [Hyphomonadaceae bacterium]|nr:response regulator [Hyphomonadaceae bacterium]